MKAKKIKVQIPDINYIPGYMIAEQERRENEVIRQSNEEERIALYEDMQDKLESGYFNGEDGFSPIVETSKSGKTTTITITDSEGTHTASILDGEDGAKGDTGDAATISVGTVSTGAAGSSASVTNSGTTSAAIFDFVIPKGADGTNGTSAGFGTPTASATGLSAGSSPTVSVTASGSNTSKVFSFTFGIPKGDKGDTGATGSTGATGQAATIAVGTVTTGASGTSASVTNSGTSSAAVFDFVIPKGDTATVDSITNAEIDALF